LGQYTGIDPLIFRIVLVVLAVFGGSGVVLYALGWLFIPAEGETDSEAERLVRGRGTLRVIAAAALAVVALIIFGQIFAGGPGPGFGGAVALAVVGVAAYFILRSDDRMSRSGDRPDAPGSPAPPGTSPPVASGTYGQTLGTAYAAGAPSSAPSGPHGDTTAPLPPYYPPPPPGPLLPDPAPTPPPRPRRERSLLGRITVSVVLLVIGVLLAVRAASSDPAPFTVVPAAALALVGLGLLVGAFYGRSRWLILLGVVLALATGAAAASESVGKEGIGVRTWAPSSIGEVQPEYRLGIGDATLDLSAVSVPAGERVVVEVAVDVGELDVLVPHEPTIDIESDTESVEASGQRTPTGSGSSSPDRIATSGRATAQRGPSTSTFGWLGHPEGSRHMEARDVTP
jgi:hypothetical protein